MKSVQLTPLSRSIIRTFLIFAIGLLLLSILYIVGTFFKIQNQRIEHLENNPAVVIKEVIVEVTASPSARPTIRVQQPVRTIAPTGSN